MAVETENQREMDARDDILRGSLRGAIAGLFSTTLSVLKVWLRLNIRLFKIAHRSNRPSDRVAVQQGLAEWYKEGVQKGARGTEGEGNGYGVTGTTTWRDKRR